jgi:hypothetical protein
LKGKSRIAHKLAPETLCRDELKKTVAVEISSGYNSARSYAAREEGRRKSGDDAKERSRAETLNGGFYWVVMLPEDCEAAGISKLSADNDSEPTPRRRDNTEQRSLRPGSQKNSITVFETQQTKTCEVKEISQNARNYLLSREAIETRIDRSNRNARR